MQWPPGWYVQAHIEPHGDMFLLPELTRNVPLQDDVVSKPFRARELTPKITELLLNPSTGPVPYSPLSMASTDAESAS